MIKLRLHGLFEDIEKVINFLESRSEIRVLCASAPYADGGKSKYVRVYVDIEYDTNARGGVRE
ncbi:MAG: hypothetical protein J6B04_05505 [Clostridia bacterium]|nr:hypothetical protein [Clostridia bacterium]